MIDADAFNEFEAHGWERSASGYDSFFGPITGWVVEPLLDAAGVGAGTRVLDVATGPGYVALTTWDRPEHARLLGVFVDATATAAEAPSTAVPAGPDFFRFSDEAEFSALLRGQGLDQVAIQTIAFTHAVATADALWKGMLAATVRTSALIVSQPPDIRRRIRAAFDQLVERHRRSDGALELGGRPHRASPCRPHRRAQRLWPRHVGCGLRTSSRQDQPTRV